MSEDQFVKINKIIKNKDFIVYKDYYEQVYVYSLLLFLNSVSLGVNYSINTIHINSYIKIFKHNLESVTPEKVLLYREHIAYFDFNCNNEVIKYINNVKSRLKKEWEADCGNNEIVILNYYEKNVIPLNELKAYIKKEIKNFNNEKI